MSDEGASRRTHEKLLGPQPDELAHYRLLPLVMLFVLSGCVLFAATYLNRYSGHFDPSIYDENQLPTKGAPVEVKIDPIVLGKRLFNTPGYCVTCHQANGQGVPATYPPLAGSEWVNGPEDRVIRIVLYGLQGVVHVEGKDFNAAAMPVFGEVVEQRVQPERREDRRGPDLCPPRSGATRAGPGTRLMRSPRSAPSVGQDHKSWTEDQLEQIK